MDKTRCETSAHQPFGSDASDSLPSSSFCRCYFGGSQCEAAIRTKDICLCGVREGHSNRFKTSQAVGFSFRTGTASHCTICAVEQKLQAAKTELDAIALESTSCP